MAKYITRSTIAFLDDSLYRMASNFLSITSFLNKFQSSILLHAFVLHSIRREIFIFFFLLCSSCRLCNSPRSIHKTHLIFITSIARNVCLYYCSIYSCLLYDKMVISEINIAFLYKLISKSHAINTFSTITIYLVFDLQANLYSQEILDYSNIFILSQNTVIISFYKYCYKQIYL